MTKTKLKPRPSGLDRPSTTKIIKGMSVVHRWMYRVSGGQLGKKWHVGSALVKGVPICLLTTTGRVTGQPRTVPLLHMADGDRVILVASKGGLPSNPQWYGNLKANPDVEVQVGRKKRAMRARPAEPNEREKLWPRLVGMYRDFESYQTWTDRQIPVVICEPA
jgi:F420H(2)-dependent quinone reductase